MGVHESTERNAATEPSEATGRDGHDGATTVRDDCEHQLDLRVLRFRCRPESDEPALLALALVEAGRTTDALEVVDAALAADPDDVDLLLGCGAAAMRSGELSFAQLVLTRAAKKAPEWSEPLRALAKVLVLRGREDRAVEVARRAIALDGGDEETRELVRRHDRRVALDARLARFREAPEDEEPALLAQALLDEGRARDAIEVVDAALAHEADDADLRVVEARARLARREDAAAEEALRRAVALAPEWSEPARMLAELLAERGALLDALAVVERILPLAPEEAELVALHGRIDERIRAAGIARSNDSDAELDELLASLERIAPIGAAPRAELEGAEATVETPVPLVSERRRRGWLPAIARRLFGGLARPGETARPVARA